MSPATVLMVCCTDWLEKRKQPSGLNKLYVSCGIWVDKQGQSYLDNFEPRLVTCGLGEGGREEEEEEGEEGGPASSHALSTWWCDSTNQSQTLPTS